MATEQPMILTVEGEGGCLEVEIPPEFFREFKPVPELVPMRTEPYETFPEFLARHKKAGTDYWNRKCSKSLRSSQR